jgi:cation:H+ antiporter
MELTVALIIVVLASAVIMYVCDSFDAAASYLGRNMKPGVRGATINAIGSSMPELMTAMFLLFLYHDQDGFSAAIATTAGSAVFNSVVIPMVCILAVRYKGVSTVTIVDGVKRIVREKINGIEVSKITILRDGFFLLAAEAALIWFLSGNIMAWWMGACLMGIYLLYFAFLMTGFGGGNDDEEDEDDYEDGDDNEQKSKIKALITFDFNNLLFDGESFSTRSAWVVLTLATTVIGIACWQLAEAVMMSANALDVPPYFTAVILAAAATSVPDTVLSVKDALRGDYDDAISNALGSNTFDITVALGLPLFLYGLMYGDVFIASSQDTQVLRIVLFAVTMLVLSLFLFSKRVTVLTSYILGVVYLGWIIFLVCTMMAVTTIVTG